MPVAIIRNINVGANSISLNCETDLTDPESGTAVFMQISFTRQQLALWKEDNPTGTNKQFLQEKALETYTWFQKTIEKTTGLKGKDIFTL